MLRGVRPIGLWSMSMTLSTSARPATVVVRADRQLAAVQRARHGGVEDLVDERALARARHAGHAHEQAQRELDVDVLQVVLARAATVSLRPSPRRRWAGSSMREVAAQVAAGQAGLRRAHHLGGRARRHDLPAVPAGARAEVDDPVGLLHRLVVVLDHHHRVADVAQVLERRQQLLVVALVQADRGLVQHVDDAGQLAADLAGQPDALALAARERRRRPVQRQVAEAHVEQEAQARADLLQQLRRDLRLRPFRPSPSKKAWAAATLSAVTSAMFWPAILTPSASRRTRWPPQAEQGRVERNFW